MTGSANQAQGPDQAGQGRTTRILVGQGPGHISLDCHFPDGDNWGDADNNLCVVLAQQLLTVASEVGYGEISERGYQSPLMTALRGLSDPRFRTVALHERKDVYRALKTLFSPRPAEP